MAFKANREMAAQAMRKINWARVDATTDKEIERQVAEDPDTAPLTTNEHLIAASVVSTRKRLRLTQVEFARTFALPVGTVRDWEQARSVPDAPALALLRMIDREPEAALRAMVPEPG